MSLAAFALECVAVFAALCLAASLVVAAAHRAAAPFLSRRAPARRADAAFALLLVGPWTALAVVAASVWPSLLASLGVAQDHCAHHIHHPHLCFLHGYVARPALVAFGAAALGAWLLLAARRLGSDWRAAQRLSLPSHEARVHLLPTAAPVCATVGALRPVVLVSRRVAEALTPSQLRAALAHERAHVRRRDPLARLLLRWAALCVWPPLAERLLREHELASELACDTEAAAAVGDPLVVAEALLTVARLGAPPQLGGAAAHLAPETLELRIAALLRAPVTPRPAWAWPLAAALLAGVAAVAAAASHELHHAVETLLHVVS